MADIADLKDLEAHPLDKEIRIVVSDSQAEEVQEILDELGYVITDENNAFENEVRFKFTADHPEETESERSDLVEALDEKGIKIIAFFEE